MSTDDVVSLGPDPSADEPEQPSTGSDTERGYTLLRRAILTGHLPPGSTWSQADLSQLLNVGRTPIREAARRLQAEALLNSQHNRRIQIAPLDINEFEDISAQRILLETLAIRMSVPLLTADDFARIREHLDILNAGLPAQNNAALRGFHDGLFRRARPSLAHRCKELGDHADRYWQLFFRDKGQGYQPSPSFHARDEHEEILEAALAGEAETCARVNARHLGWAALTGIAWLDVFHDARQVRMALNLVGVSTAAGENSVGPGEHSMG